MKSLVPDINQQKLTDKSHITIISNEDKKTELLLAVYIALHSSIRSIDHLTDVYNRISKNNSIKLHRTKCSLLIKKVIAPAILKDQLHDIGDGPYSLIVDESTDVATIKYLCICVRYFSKRTSKILVCFLGLVEVEQVTANNLYLKLKEFLTNCGLKITNMIGLGTDGANNLCGRYNSLYARLKEDNPKLQLVRCICHSLNNASSKAAEVLPSNLDFLCREIYAWFSHSSLRRIEYKRLYDILNNGEKPFHNFVQLCSTRWLCRYNVINILLEHYDELKTHFRFVVNKEKCYTAKMLNEMLHDETNYLYFIIIKPVLHEINNVNCIFQSNYVEIGNAIEDLKRLVFFISKKVLKPIFTKNINDIVKNVNNELAYVEANDIDFGIEYYKYCHNTKMNLSKSDIDNVQYRAGNYLRQLLLELVKRLPLNIDLFTGMQLLNSKVCLSTTTRSKFCDLPLIDIFINANDLSTAEVEYNSLTSVNWNLLYGDNIYENSFIFWPIVAQHKNAGNSLAFNTIAQYVLKILCLPMSNAVVERMFSIMNVTKDKIRNRMATEMLNALLTIKCHCYANQYCCRNFVCTQQMLENFNKHMYLCKNETALEDKQYEEDLHTIEAVNETDDVDFCIKE